MGGGGGGIGGGGGGGGRGGGAVLGVGDSVEVALAPSLGFWVLGLGFRIFGFCAHYLSIAVTRRCLQITQNTYTCGAMVKPFLERGCEINQLVVVAVVVAVESITHIPGIQKTVC